jgi:hypothetical protein
MQDASPSRLCARLKDPPLTMPLTKPLNNAKPETGPHRGTGQRPPFCVSCISSRPGHVTGLAALCLCAYFRDPCTVMHKRPIPARDRYPRNQNKSHLFRRNWLRSAKRPATSPPVGIRDAHGQKPKLSRFVKSIARPSLSRVLRPDRGSFFPRRPTKSRVFSSIRGPVFRDPRTVMDKPKSGRHLPLPDNSNNIQPLIENWLCFAKAPAASTHCAGAPIGQPALSEPY